MTQKNTRVFKSLSQVESIQVNSLISIERKKEKTKRRVRLGNTWDVNANEGVDGVKKKIKKKK